MARVKKRPRVTRDAVLLISGIAAAIYGIVFAEGGLSPTVLTLILGWTLSPVAMRVDEAIGRAKAKTAKDQP